MTIIVTTLVGGVRDEGDTLSVTVAAVVFDVGFVDVDTADGAGAGEGAMMMVLVSVGAGPESVTVLVLVVVLVSFSTTVEDGRAVDPPSTLTIEYDFARGTTARLFGKLSRGSALTEDTNKSAEARDWSEKSILGRVQGGRLLRSSGWTTSKSG